MKCIYPDYENGLVNVMSSIMKHFNIPSEHNSNKLLDNLLKKGQYKNIVLVVFDGLGFNILKRNKDVCPFLNEHLVTFISSNFPSTTMSSRTTIESGLCPIEHGWLGWDMYFKDFDEVITLTRNTIKGTKKKASDFHIAKTYLNYESIVEKINKIDGCKAKKLTVYSDRKYESFRKARHKIKKSLKNKLNNYIYLYSNEPDHTIHEYATDSNDTKILLKKLDRNFKKICSKINSNTLVLALADHGHINCDYITLDDYPEIVKMLDGNISIDNRACSFRVKDEYKDIFKEKLENILKDDFIILTKDEVIEKKLYGNGIENKYFKDGLGDFFAIGINNKAIRLNKTNHEYKSSHSGITEDEMLVPLIIYKKDKV